MTLNFGEVRNPVPLCDRGSCRRTRPDHTVDRRLAVQRSGGRGVAKRGAAGRPGRVGCAVEPGERRPGGRRVGAGVIGDEALAVEGTHKVLITRPAGDAAGVDAHHEHPFDVVPGRR